MRTDSESDIDAACAASCGEAVTSEDPIARAASDVVGLYTRHAGAWDRIRGAEVRQEGDWLVRFSSLLPTQ